MGTIRNKKPDLINSLINDSSQYNVMQFLRLLEQHLPQPISVTTNNPGLKLISAPELTFPASDIKSCTLQHQQLVTQLTFMGLCGVDSPLPQYFAEYIQANNANSACLYDFLNIFSNRIYTLLYLVWKKYHIFLNPEKSKYLNYLIALSGNILTPQDQQEYAFAGLMGSQHHNCSSLTAMLSDYLQAAVLIDELMPVWVELNNTLSIGQDNISIGDNAILGNHAIAAQKIIIRVGPLSLQQAIKILPDQSAYQRLINLISRYVDLHISYDIILILRPATTCITLGKNNVKLGWTSWIGKCGNLNIKLIHA